MYRRLERSSDNVLGYHLSGKITKDEVKEIQREVDQAMEAHGKVRLLCEIGDLSMPEPSAIWQDLKMTPEYLKGVERAAVVGDARWHRWATEISDKLVRMEARHFEPGRKEEAWDWLEGATPAA